MAKNSNWAKAAPLSLALGLTSCFGGPNFLKQNESYEVQEAALRIKAEGETTSATVSSNSLVTQTISASGNSSISGVKLAVQPGTFAFDTTIALEESASLAVGMVSQNLGITLNSAAGKAVSIAADKLKGAELSKPLTLAIPLDDLGLRLLSDQTLVIVYRIQKGEEILEGVIPSSKLTLVGNEVKFNVFRFGAYQPVYIPKAEESIAEAVTETKTEAKILTKTEVIKLPETTIAKVTITDNNRVVTFSTTISNGEAKACYFLGEPYEGNGEPERASLGNKTTYTMDFRNDPDRIYGRVKISCLLTDGRILDSGFSDIDLPALEKPPSGGNTGPSGNINILANIYFEMTEISVSGSGFDSYIKLEFASDVVINTASALSNSCWLIVSESGSSVMRACGEYQTDGTNPRVYRRGFHAHQWAVNNEPYYLVALQFHDTQGHAHYYDAPLELSDGVKFDGTNIQVPTFIASDGATDTTPPTVSSLSRNVNFLDFSMNDSSGSGAVEVCFEVAYAGETTGIEYCWESGTVIVSSGQIDMRNLVPESDFPSGQMHKLLRVSFGDRAFNRVSYCAPEDAGTYYKDCDTGATTSFFVINWNPYPS